MIKLQRPKTQKHRMRQAQTDQWKPEARPSVLDLLRKKQQPANTQKAAEAAPVPPGKDTIVIGGRELPRANAPGVSLTPAQLPEVKSSEQAKPED